MLKKAEVVRLSQVEHILSEKTILALMDHPFIVKMGATFQDEKFLYMVLEYIVGGEFFTHLRKAGRFDNMTSKFYSAQVAMIFEYLHEQDIIYVSSFFNCAHILFFLSLLFSMSFYICLSLLFWFPCHI